MDQGAAEPLSREEARRSIRELVDKRALGCAIALAHTLAAATSSFEDQLTLCHCLFLNGDFRRSIMILERCGVALTDSLERASNLIESVLADTVLRQVSKEDKHSLEGALLLVQCLERSEDYRECLQVLTKLLKLGPDPHVLESHTIFFADSSETARQIQLILSQLFCSIGHCFEHFEQKKKAYGAFQRALAIDHRCTEAFGHLVTSPSLDARNAAALRDSCLKRCSSEERNVMAQFYNQILTQQQLRKGLSLTKLALMVQEASAPRSVELVESLFNRGYYVQAHSLSKALLSHDPLSPTCALLCLSCMVLLRKTSDLFCLAHELMVSHPKQALSLYAVSCYYFTLEGEAGGTRTKDLCLTYLRKACKRDKRFAHAFLLLGHVLSASEESDQAMAAYRTASRLLPDEPVMWVSMGQELIRINSCSLAIHALLQAQQLNPWSAAVCNELGVACLRLRRSEEALKHFQRAAELLLQESTEVGADGLAAQEPPDCCASPRNVHHSIVFSNFATALRAGGYYENALQWYERALSLNPSDGVIVAALGFTHHMLRRFDDAIMLYHQSLALQPKLNVASDLLCHALNDVLFYTSAPVDSRCSS